MKATGVVRRIDDLGRIVIPKEIRKVLRIKEGDPLEVFTDREGQVILKKYSPIGELSEFASGYAETLSKTTGHIACITDKDTVIAISGGSKKEYLEKAVKNTENRSFDIVELENNKLIGTIGLEKINWINRSAVLGIFIGDEEYRNNGYGTEAIKLILEYGFKYLNIHNIRLDLISMNERAHKCYLKCGFKDAGRSREEVFLNGKYYDKLHMDILENEFQGDYIRNKNVK